MALFLPALDLKIDSIALMNMWMRQLERTQFFKPLNGYIYF